LNGQAAAERSPPRIVAPSHEEPAAVADAAAIRGRTQFGLGPAAAEAVAPAPPTEALGTTRDAPEARAEGVYIAEGKVIPFPAPRREEEDLPEPILEPVSVPPAASPPAAAEQPVNAPSELRPTVREPAAQRRLDGPSGTLRLDTTAALDAAAPAPAGDTLTSTSTSASAGETTPAASPPVPPTMSSSPHHEPPPSSQGTRETAPRAGSVAHPEEHFFKIGDAGEYEGGPSHRPPPLAAEADVEEHELHHPRVSIRTPEQEERRAGFIRWVVLLMGFGIAIPIMGFIVKKLSPPPAAEETPHAEAPAPAAPEPVQVTREPATAIGPLPAPPAVEPAPSAQPSAVVEIPAGPPSASAAPDASAAPAEMKAPDVVPPAAPAEPVAKAPVVKAPAAPKPAPVVTKPAPVAPKPAAATAPKPKAPVSAPAPKPKATAKKPEEAPKPPLGTASFPVD
jgi:hypothetical protein